MKEETRVFTGGLNKDDDPRFLPNGDWIDALNASVLNREGTGGDIVAEIGNEEISLYRSSGSTAYSLPSGTNTTIGSVDDPVRGHTYWFVHNSNNNHAILRYEYDTNIARLIWEDNSFNKTSNTFNASSYAGAYSPTTAYTRGQVVLSSGNFYLLTRANYLERNVVQSYTNSGAGSPNRIIFTTTHYLKTGDKITFDDNGGSIGGLSTGTVYYAILVSATVIKVATTFANAVSNTEVPLSGSISNSPYFEMTPNIDNTRIWKNISNVLNFSTSYPIFSSVVIEQNQNVFLLWTDNNNQPSFLDVTSTSQPRILTKETLDLYAPQPLHPPTAEYGDDSAVDQNKVMGKALQFRYAWKLKDGRTTVMSPISRVAIPTVNKPTNTQEANKIQLQIPLPDIYENLEEAYLYVKENNDNNVGDWYLVNTFDVSSSTVLENPSPYADRYNWYIPFDFFNTSKLSAVNLAIQNQVQDFIPLKSKCLAVGGNGRVILGNNLDGFNFDTSTLDVTVDAVTTSFFLNSNNAPQATFKKGCRYPIGIVYADRNGRVSNVYRNDDMVLNVPFHSFANQGRVYCRLSIGHAPPSWAEYWIPVYGGNQTMQSWIQSAATAVSDPSIQLIDLNGWNADIVGYTWAQADNQFVRPVYDASDFDFFADDNGTGVLESYNASTDVVETDFDAFTVNPANNDLIEVYQAKATALDTDEIIWHEMGWAFAIEIDENGNRVHGSTSSFYGNLKDYTDVTYTSVSYSQVADFITLNTTHGLEDGDPVMYKGTGGSSIGGLTNGTVYYAITTGVGTNQIKLAATYDDAINGIDINLTGTTTSGAEFITATATDFDVQSQIIGSGAQDCVVVLDQADCYIRYYEDFVATNSLYKTFEFTDLYITSKSDVNVDGRPNLVNDDFKQTRREQELVYSEPIVDNTDFFGINRFFDISFNDSLNNAYGELTVMHSGGNELFCIQETKVARILANKNFIYTGDLQSIDIQSNVFLSEPQYFPQDFGCQNPESFADYGGVKFWVDRLKGAVLISSGDSVENISQIKMSSYFENNLAYPYPYNDNSDTFANGNKIYSGYSIRDNSYYITLDAHKLIIRNVSTSGTEYTITMTALDIEDGTFDRLVDIGVVPIKSEVNTYDAVWEGLTITSSDSSAKTITVDSGVSIGTIFAGLIYVPFVQTLSFSKDRGRWISRHSFTPEWMSSSGNSLISFQDGKCYVHNLTSYQTAFFGTNFNYTRYYGSDPAGALDDTVKNLFVEFPFNQEPNIVKEPITIATDSNQVFNIDYAVNESGQITDNETTDYEEFEGYYWSPIFKDKTTPVVTYPLLEGDLVKGKYLKARLKAKTYGGQASISSVKLKYNNSNLT